MEVRLQEVQNTLSQSCTGGGGAGVVEEPSEVQTSGPAVTRPCSARGVVTEELVRVSAGGGDRGGADGGDGGDDGGRDGGSGGGGGQRVPHALQ